MEQILELWAPKRAAERGFVQGQAVWGADTGVRKIGKFYRGQLMRPNSVVGIEPRVRWRRLLLSKDPTMHR